MVCGLSLSGRSIGYVEMDLKLRMSITVGDAKIIIKLKKSNGKPNNFKISYER